MSVTANETIDAVAASMAQKHHRMTLGLRPLQHQHWICDLPDFGAQLREKRHLLATQDDVLATLPESSTAQRELLRMVASHVAMHFPEQFSRNGDLIYVRANDAHISLTEHDSGAIATAAQLVPEDLVLMREHVDGSYRLVAAALCFPTRWRLAQKVGQPMRAIHAPVPGYDAQIGAATDKIMRAITVDRPLWRHNWSLVDSPQLYQPVRVPLPQPLRFSELGTHLWLRTERQTLRRLPESKDLVFGIRIVQATLAEVCTRPTIAEHLLGQLRTMPSALRQYKQMTAIHDDLQRYLQNAMHAAK
jgi:dimethylamine monooxygenase subunit A